ncbi:hypothetical protein HPB51_015837 [Rhipicephalus microplus]|uniref:DNA transposase THAP9 C-terminal domain-containing protein n=1 Tax=Rhipicephalus microplus TaxID=6941 RepID=A0A9J6F480_RHIMP|nr:hypothetical protein HPB51_015837 [Rhipicephalus microplus]
MLSVNNLVRPPKRASVDGDGPQLLFKLQDLFNKEAAPVNHVDSLAILLDDVLLEPTESEEEALADLSPKECILDYLAGYVAQKFSGMCCTDCVESLKGLQRSPSDLILVKSRGYLQVPSTKLLNLLQIAEEHVEEFTKRREEESPAALWTSFAAVAPNRCLRSLRLGSVVTRVCGTGDPG